MFQHNKKFKSHGINGYCFIIVLVTIMIPFIFSSLSYGQGSPVQISVTVSPPYTPKIIDYFKQSNKIILTIRNTTGDRIDAYMQIKVSDNSGMTVSSDPAFREKLTMEPYGIFRMNQTNYGRVVNQDHLLFKGITKQEIIEGRISENEYTICISAYDAKNNLLSGEEEGCFSFMIKAVEPPAIIQPECNSNIPASAPQFVNFSWTVPVGAPQNTEYTIKIIEILPYDKNLNEAILSPSHPVFFEKRVNVTSCLLGAADPALIPGKKYAFEITADDPGKEIKFDNNGMSLPCSFNYVTFSPLSKNDSGITCNLNGHQFLIIKDEQHPENDLVKAFHRKDKSDFVKCDTSTRLFKDKVVDLNYLGQENAKLQLLKGDNAGRIIIPRKIKEGKYVWMYENDTTLSQELEIPEIKAQLWGMVKHADERLNKNLSGASIEIITAGTKTGETTINENGEFKLLNYRFNTVEPIDISILLKDGNTYGFPFSTMTVNNDNKITMNSCNGQIRVVLTLKDVNNNLIPLDKNTNSRNKTAFEERQFNMHEIMNSYLELVTYDGSSKTLLILCPQDTLFNEVVVKLIKDGNGKPILVVLNDLKFESRQALLEYSKMTLLDLNTSASLYMDVSSHHKVKRSVRHWLRSSCGQW